MEKLGKQVLSFPVKQVLDIKKWDGAGDDIPQPLHGCILQWSKARYGARIQVSAGDYNGPNGVLSIP